MRQAWHIFKKDIRFLRGEIALVWGLAFLFFWTYEVSDNLGGIGSVLIAAALYLIARVMFAEPIPGSEQFWLTRPYRWGSLLAAKLLFILLCVNLPVFIARTAIVMAEGFPLFPALPGLLWSQGVMFLCVSLPVAALAALTPGLVPFLLSALAAATLWFASDYIDSPQYRNFMTARFPGEVRALEFDWVRSALLAAAAMIMALTVLYIQYWKRATLLSRSFACAMAVLGIFAYLTVPFAFAWAVQPDTSQGAFDRPSLNMVLRPPAEPREVLPSERYFEVDLGLALEGLAEGDDARLHALDLSVQGAGGKNLDIGPLGADHGVLGLRVLPLELRSKGVRFNASFLVERLLIVEKDTFVPVTLRGALYFTVFGNLQDELVPASNSPVLLRNGLRCGFDEWRGFQSNYFRCKSGLRWPAQFLYVNQSPLNATVSFSPFPGRLELSPIAERGRYMPVDEPKSQLIVTTKHLIAHVKKNFTINDVRLEPYARRAFSPPDGKPGQ